MKSRLITLIGSLACLLLFSTLLHAQDPFSRFRNFGGGGGGRSGGADTLAHRKADTITLNYRYLDSSRYQKLDSSVYDFSRKMPQPPTWINLGNNGAAARNLVFSPRMISGWDPGWHAYDLYLFTVDQTKFYQTTKPYTELGYFLGGKSEQFIGVQHTQNVRPNWNIGFEYRLINSIGAFPNINTNHSNIRLHSWYQSKNKRYQNFFVLVSNKLAAAENGGLQNPADLNSINYSDQATLPVFLGNGLNRATTNIFNTPISTGTHYVNATFMMRQQYDLGQKDSIVTDTTVIPLFYPRLRLEHNISYSTYRYTFSDDSIAGSPLNTAYYTGKLNLPYVLTTDSFLRRDRWKDLTNDFSIYQFPDSKNPQQFIKVGATLQLLQGTFDTALAGPIATAHRLKEQNVFVHGEYRNKTRNQKWDVEAFGKLYLNGLNTGDYNAYISLKRLLGRRIGYLQVGFQNVNRTPSFVFDAASSFYLDTLKRSFSKENTTNLFASFEQPQIHLKLRGSYYLLSNYTYFQDYYKERQESALFNLLQITAEKEFIVARHLKWRALAVVQQVAGSSPVHVPLLTVYNQIGYEGSLGFPNLLLDVGTEMRYISWYKADGYSPANGQYFSQSSTTLHQHLPDITAYMHLRIRSFTAYLRAENLNSIAFSPRGFGWYHNNFVAPNYPSPGFVIRFGFFWGFVN
ncbi:hypothetical protein Q4E93_10210 [Flavitalea sp. BT771]|uniref:putative porin n=1 Tax=Flavitalea sp. BT771 TaxID=3063329 RepID=UPI0026E1FC47|nr:putative porin [Flavitalea sp. BT771]MDO6430961.1 hypothetical protein [Flavitalea sp. BT771]MDV6219868.1 putative porin [Flavitalea sp. BT771]